jgi:hypothetical protein
MQVQVQVQVWLRQQQQRLLSPLRPWWASSGISLPSSSQTVS